MLITDGCSQAGMARQDAYMKIADMIKDHNIRPTMLIIDDKWQKTYGDCLPDPERWPDMRAFTDEMLRAEYIRSCGSVCGAARDFPRMR